MNKIEEISDDKIFTDLLNVFMASMMYVEVRSKPHNPFVKKLGTSADEEEAFQTLQKFVDEANYLCPLVGQYIKEISSQTIENKEFILYEENEALEEFVEDSQL